MTAVKDAGPRAADLFKVRPNALLSADDATLYAEFVASEPVVDRDGELILPDDFLTDSWRENPVWLWAHDRKAPPIGAGYRPDGTVSIKQSPERLVLGCRFSQANPQGTLTYALYKEGTLKMVSVGFASTGTARLPGAPYGVKHPVVKILDPELLECSAVPIGANRKAMLLSIKAAGNADSYVDRVGLASVLDRGRINGERLPPEMAADLAPFAAARGFKAAHWPNKIPNCSSDAFNHSLPLKSREVPPMPALATAPLTAGVIPGKADVTTKAAEAVETKTTPAVEVKAVEQVETKDADTSALAAKAMDTTSDAAGGTMVNPMGVDAFKAGMEHLTAFCKAMSEACGASDSASIRDYAKAWCAKIAGTVGEAFDFGSKEFPDHADLLAESAAGAADYAGEMEEKAEDDEVAEGEEVTDAEAETTDETDKKSADESVVTTKVFNEWYGKSFGETDVKDAVLAFVREAYPGLDKVSELADQMIDLTGRVTEHHDALTAVERILVPKG
jgi:hypothetical protein